MKKRNWIYLWVIGNLILLIRFFIDGYLIQCVPCIPDVPCQPCRTKFAEDIWIYFLIWNLLAVVVYVIIKKTHANNVYN